MADLDGDGSYEIIQLWNPSNAQDNSKSGFTGNVYVDAYKMDGTKLWRIDLGHNIRAGAHYTQILAYDFDGDGKAEVSMRTADGTTDGAGTVIGDAAADYRNSAGYVLSGPEFLTVFNGATGTIMDTVAYEPRPRQRRRLGRRIRQPCGPLPGRRRLPRRRKAVPDVQPRILHPHRPGHL